MSQRIDLNEHLLTTAREQRATWFDQTILKSYDEDKASRYKQPELITKGKDQSLSPQKDQKASEEGKINWQDGKEIPFGVKKKGKEFIYEFINNQGTDEAPDFYYKTAAEHVIPTVQILNHFVLKEDPSIFATFAKASDQFSSFGRPDAANKVKEEMNLLEYMCIGDYKKLLHFRLRIYVAIIKTLYRAYYNYQNKQKQREKYQEFRLKLLQVREVLKCIGYFHHYEKLYERLQDDATKDLCVLETEETLLEPGKANFIDLDEDKLNDYDSDDEFDNYLNDSRINSQTYFKPNLLKEEQKWKLRADWLEKELEELRYNQDTLEWYTWIQAKIDSLQDLDVKVDMKNKQKDTSNILYLEELISGIKNFKLQEDYRQQQKTSIDDKSNYPKIANKIDSNHENNNTFKFQWGNYNCIREKLCLQVLNLEQETDYFVTAYQKKPFGCEKLYEKRINCRRQYVTVQKSAFHPSGDYLYLVLDIQNFMRTSIDSDEKISVRLNLIFPLKSQFKAPQVVKDGHEFVCFNERYAFFMDKQENKAYEYDLYDMHKTETVVVRDLKKDFEFTIGEEGPAPVIERKENFYFSKKILTKTGKEKENQIQFQILTKDLMDVKVIFDKPSETVGQLDQLYKHDTILNENGDGLLFVKQQKCEGEIQVTKFVIDKHTHLSLGANKYKVNGDVRLLKQEKRLYFKNGKDSNQPLEPAYYYAYKVIPFGSKYVILFCTKEVNKPAFIFLDDEFVTQIKIEGTIDTFMNGFIPLQKPSNKLKGVYLDILEDKLKKGNDLQYIFIYPKQLESDQTKVEWRTEKNKHAIQNDQIFTFHPYLSFFYNHDQLILKDMKENNRFYYMNNFFGIDNSQRILCAYMYCFNKSLTLSTVSINRGYTNKDIQFRVNNLRNRRMQTMRGSFSNFVKYCVYTYNISFILKYMYPWLGDLLSKEDQCFAPDIRVSSRNDAIYFEKFVQNKCTFRAIISRTNSTPAQNDTPDNPQAYHEEFNFSYPLILIQSQDVVSIYTAKFESRHSALESLLTRFNNPLLRYKLDSQTDSDIFDVCFDSMQHGLVDVYIIFSNGTLKRFTAELGFAEWSEPEKVIKNDKFYEDYHLYSIEKLFAKSQDKVDSSALVNKDETASSQTDIASFNVRNFDPQIRIVNKMIYITTENEKYIAEIDHLNKVEKLAKGRQITDFYQQKPKRFGYSLNEAKLVSIFTSDRPYISVITSLLLNARSLPLFQCNTFVHVGIPLINSEEHYFSTFSLHLEPKYNWYQCRSGEKLRDKSYRHMLEQTPGILIKHFNGFEDKIYLKDFGIEFFQIVKFSQSNNGRYIMISGMVKEDNKPMYTLDFKSRQGTFVFEMSKNSIKYLAMIEFASMNKIYLKQHLPIILHEQFQAEIEGMQYEEYDVDANIREGSDFNIDNYNFNSELDPLKYSKRLKKEEIHKAVTEELLKEHNKTALSQIPGWQSLLVGKMLLEEIKEEYTQKEKDAIEERNKKGLQVKDEVFYSKIVELEVEQGSERKTLNGKPISFELPYLEVNHDSYYQQHMDQVVKQHRIDKKEVEKQPEVEPPKEEEKQLSEEEQKIKEDKEKEEEKFRQKIETQSEKLCNVYDQLIWFINEVGDIFIIHRVQNILYYFKNQRNTQFGSCSDGYIFYEFKYPTDQIIKFVDSSKELLVIASKKAYNVYLNQGKQDRIDLLYSADFTFKEPTLAKGQTLQAVLDPYNLTIQGLSLCNDHLFLKVTDDQQQPLHIGYVFRKDDNQQFLKLPPLNTEMIPSIKQVYSGDKNYLWFVEKNQIFNMYRNTSTFFLWPGKRVKTVNYCLYDVFNINEDSTIMITQGQVFLAFDYISYLIHKEKDIEEKTKHLHHMYYKIRDYWSILEQINQDDKDKDNKEFSEQEKNDHMSKLSREINESKLTIIHNQMKRMAELLQCVENHSKGDSFKKEEVALFFLSYYYKKTALDELEENALNLRKYPPIQHIFMKLCKEGTNRKDIAHEVLSYVQGTGLPIIWNAVLSEFKTFLEGAGHSEPFLKHMNDMIRQTQEMAMVEKFAVKLDEEEQTFVGSHNSILLDTNFQMKFKQGFIKQDVTISYAYIGDLLSKKDFTTILEDDKFLGILDHELIRKLVMFQWYHAKKIIERRLLYPFFALLGFFFIYSTYMIDWYRDSYLREGVYNFPDNITVGEQTFELELSYQAELSFVWLANVAIIFALIIYLSSLEIQSFWKNGTEYIKDIWNYIDFINYTGCMTVIVMDAMQSPVEYIRPICAVAVIVLWFKLFYFMRVFDYTSQLIRMIIEIVNSMRNFLIVLSIGILGFANGLFIIAQNQTHTDEIEPFTGSNFLNSCIYTYRMALGDFQLDEYYNLTPVDVIIVWIIFTGASMFVVIVLLNLLIAIMNATFGNVMDNITNITIREKIKLVKENDFLFDRSEVFKNSEFLIIIKDKNLVNEENEQKKIIQKINNFNQKLVDRVANFQLELKERIQDFEENMKQQQAQQEQRISQAVKNDMGAVMQKITETYQDKKKRQLEDEKDLNSLMERFQQNQKIMFEQIGKAIKKKKGIVEGGEENAQSKDKKKTK